MVVGPEAPLTLGLADACAAAGLRCFGPSAAAAQLEGSKTFTKEVADAAGVPTAAWARFTDPAAARAYIRAQGAPIVVKADGLAAGKGVVVAATVEEAEAAIADIMEDRVHGAAGAAVVIEECLVGQEVSFFALCDGKTALAAGRGAGPQAGRRRRYRAEHRRHGRLFPAAGLHPGRCTSRSWPR